MQRRAPRRSAESPFARHLGRSVAIHTDLVPVLTIVFVATLIRSAFGFGEALVAVPLLALFIPLRVATPLAVLLSVTIAAIVVIQDWKKIHLGSAGGLLLATLPGLPLGLWLLAGTYQQLAKFVLGAAIVLFAGYSLLGRAPIRLERDHRGWLLACGFCAGVFGGAFGMNGPPLVIYGTMRRWTPQQFRATLQAYFLPAGLMALAGYGISGVWTPAVTRDYLLALPVMLPGVFLGRFINHRLRGSAFLRFVYAGLACIGILLLTEALRGH